MSHPVRVGFVGTGGIANSPSAGSQRWKTSLSWRSVMSSKIARTKLSQRTGAKHIRITIGCLMKQIWMRFISAYRPLPIPTQRSSQRNADST